MSPWYEFFLDYDPASDISKTTCPVLVMNGEKDLQVIASSNVETIKKQSAKKQEVPSENISRTESLVSRVHNGSAD